MPPSVKRNRARNFTLSRSSTSIVTNWLAVSHEVVDGLAVDAESRGTIGHHT